MPDPAVDNGWAVAPTGLQRWYGLARGTSLLALASPVPFSIAVEQVALELQDPTLAGPNFVNATGNGADRWKTLTYAELSNAFDRGGKLLQYHGLADIVIFPQGSANYYERVAASMGGIDAVQSFYRLFFVPGMSHGPGNGTSNPDANPPYPATGQVYSMLTDWVEKGAAPDSIVVQSAGSMPAAKSQPLCAYPKKVTFQGGDAFSAASYGCS